MWRIFQIWLHFSNQSLVCYSTRPRGLCLCPCLRLCLPLSLLQHKNEGFPLFSDFVFVFASPFASVFVFFSSFVFVFASSFASVFFFSSVFVFAYCPCFVSVSPVTAQEWWIPFSFWPQKNSMSLLCASGPRVFPVVIWQWKGIREVNMTNQNHHYDHSPERFNDITMPVKAFLSVLFYTSAQFLPPFQEVSTFNWCWCLTTRIFPNSSVTITLLSNPVKDFPTCHKTDIAPSHICSSNSRSRPGWGKEAAREGSGSSSPPTPCSLPSLSSQWNPFLDRHLLPRRFGLSTTPSGLNIGTNCW